MANEFQYGSIGDLRATSLLHQELKFLLMDPTDLRTTLVRDDSQFGGSAAVKVGQVSLAGAMSAPGEVTQVSNTAVTDASYTLTVAHYTLQHEVSYLAEITGGGNGADTALLARKILGSATLTLTDLVATLFGSLSSTVGTSAVDLDVDDVYDGQFALHNALVPGPYFCILYPQQINDFITSLRGETGAMQFQQATAEMLGLRGPGFQGRWNNIEFWSCDSVPTANAGADSCGAMYGLGAFAFTEAPVTRMIPYIQKVAAMEGARLFIEAKTVQDYGKIRLTGHYFPAASIAEQGRGVAIITDR